MNYKEQLQDQRWIKRRRGIKERDDHKCMLCGSRDVMLNVHHLHYKDGCNAWDYKDKELATLCEDCHKWVHETGIELEVRRSRILSKYRLCLPDDNTDDIHSGSVLVSDEMDLIIASADVPFVDFQVIQNVDGSRVDPSQYPKWKQVEAQVSIRKDGTDLAFNEYILPIEVVSLRPATDEEVSVLMEGLKKWLCNE